MEMSPLLPIVFVQFGSHLGRSLCQLALLRWVPDQSHCRDDARLNGPIKGKSASLPSHQSNHLQSGRLWVGRRKEEHAVIAAGIPS